MKHDKCLSRGHKPNIDMTSHNVYFATRVYRFQMTIHTPLKRGSFVLMDLGQYFCLQTRFNGLTETTLHSHNA